MGDVKLLIKELLDREYNLGNVEDVIHIKAGDTNDSFFAICNKDGEEKKWYVRQYCAAEEERDIVYEHAFEKYFFSRTSDDIQKLLPVPRKDGKTWSVESCNGADNYYAVFNTISGREPYSWEYNDLSDNAFVSCAEITAKFQAWAYGFMAPEGSGRREPPLFEQFKVWRKDIPEYFAIKKADKNFKRFTDYYEHEIPFILDTIDFCEKELEIYKDDLKKCINHKDLNPGNVMFDENDQINAIFDMDWVNEDYRLYDISWMCYQIIASWDVNSWGEVPIHKIKEFIDIYNKTIEEMECPLGKMTPQEVQFLPVMMIIGCVKVVMDFTCYEEHSHDVHRMFLNTWRFVSSIHFMRDYLEDIQKSL